MVFHNGHNYTRTDSTFFTNSQTKSFFKLLKTSRKVLLFELCFETNSLLFVFWGNFLPKMELSFYWCALFGINEKFKLKHKLEFAVNVILISVLKPEYLKQISEIRWELSNPKRQHIKFYILTYYFVLSFLNHHKKLKKIAKPKLFVVVINETEDNTKECWIVEFNLQIPHRTELVIHQTFCMYNKNDHSKAKIFCRKLILSFFCQRFLWLNIWKLCIKYQPTSSINIATPLDFSSYFM